MYKKIFIFILVIISFYIGIYIIKINNIKREEEILVNGFYNIDKKNNISNNENYIGILKIDKIGLKKGFYSYNSDKNTLKNNIMLIDKSIMPDNENSIVILAGHSGNYNNAYFNNLEKLKKYDIINIEYNNKLYTYYIQEIENQKKDGKIELSYIKNKRAVVLITCNKYEKDMQTVYIAYEGEIK